jgi:hypothetical protein
MIKRKYNNALWLSRRKNENKFLTSRCAPGDFFVVQTNYKLMRTVIAIITCLFSVALSAATYGESGHLYKLPWNNPTEVLEYCSCGCADSCWTAEVRTKKTKSLKAKLRCDCEKLYVFIPEEHAERVYQENCSAFENDYKMEIIKKSLEKILNR